jgi:hypothetical protein
VRLELPVCGECVELRLPRGHDDALVAEHRGDEVELAIQLLSRLAGNQPEFWLAIPLTDVDYAVLGLRRGLFGDAIRSDVRCGGECGQRVDIAFDIGGYLAHHLGNRGHQAAPVGGWFGIGEQQARPPTCGDLIELGGSTTRVELVARCFRTAPRSPRLLRTGEKSLEIAAPNLASELTGVCPGCSGQVSVLFDPISFVMAELAQAALPVYDEVDVLAARYHWSEHDILSLPSWRRRRYVDAALSEAAS